MLGETGAGDHANECLTQHLFVAAVNGVRGVLTPCAGSQFHLLPCQSLK